MVWLRQLYSEKETIYSKSIPWFAGSHQILNRNIFCHRDIEAIQSQVCACCTTVEYFSYPLSSTFLQGKQSPYPEIMSQGEILKKLDEQMKMEKGETVLIPSVEKEMSNNHIKVRHSFIPSQNPPEKQTNKVFRISSRILCCVRNLSRHCWKSAMLTRIQLPAKIPLHMRHL